MKLRQSLQDFKPFHLSQHSCTLVLVKPINKIMVSFRICISRAEFKVFKQINNHLSEIQNRVIVGKKYFNENLIYQVNLVTFDVYNNLS